jgi:hypothetical protein
MTEPDDALETLRRARPELPDELASSHAPAAQALLEEILSMDTMHPSGVLDAIPGSRGGGRHPRRLALFGVAATLLTTAAIATVVTLDSGTQVEAAAQVRAALAETSAVMDGTGRAEVEYRFHEDDGDVGHRSSSVVHFSGDDYAVGSSPDEPGDEMRVVDGEIYTSNPSEGAPEWVHDTHPSTPDLTFNLDPRTLVERLRVRGDFEVIGDEDVDGVRTTRLQAMRPEAIPGETAAFFIPGAFSEGGVDVEVTVTSLDLWVDEDNLVRRLELSVSDRIVSAPPEFGELTESERLSAWSFSMRFYDFGAPITIEAPAEYVELPASEG